MLDYIQTRATEKHKELKMLRLREMSPRAALLHLQREKAVAWEILKISVSSRGNYQKTLQRSRILSMQKLKITDLF